MKDLKIKISLILSLVFLFISLSLVSANAGNVGYDNIGSESDSTANRIRGTWFTADETGEIDNVVGYFRAGHYQSNKCAVYDENLELITTTEEIGNVPNGYWISFNALSFNSIMYEGNDYFIACWIDTRGSALAYDEGGNSGKNDNYTYDGYPNSLTLASLDRTYSLYVELIEAVIFEVLSSENITDSSADLRGHLITDGNEPALAGWFRWRENGTSSWTDSYLDKVYFYGNDNVYFNHTADGLSPDTTYEYQVILNRYETSYPEYVSGSEYFTTNKEPKENIYFNGLLKVSGTIFNRYENGEIFTQVVDENGNPENSITVNLDIIRENGSIFESGSMSYVSGSNGIYSYDFETPMRLGVYCIDAVAVGSTDNAYSSSTFQVQEFRHKPINWTAEEYKSREPDARGFSEKIKDHITDYVPWVFVWIVVVALVIGLIFWLV